MLLARLVEISAQVAATSRRLEKIGSLSGLLNELTPSEAEIAVAYLSGQTLQGKIGLGYGALRDAQPPPAPVPGLSLSTVNQTLELIAAEQGTGAARRRMDLLHGLLRQATGPEQQFLSRLLTGELRQGALEGIMLDAMARAARVPLERVRRAAMLAGGITAIARPLFENGEAGLAEYDVRLFRPLQPMLAQTAEDVTGALSELGQAALEYKLDGARIQVHRSGDGVAVFSRGLNDVTIAVPEVVEAVRALPGGDLILDGEVIGLHPDGRPLPFQATMRRFGRKLDVDRLRAELPLTPFWFDLLYLDGAHLLDESQGRRFATLAGLVPAAALIPNAIVSDPLEGERFLEQALAHGHEGVMAKALNAPYAAGGRGQSWLKIKQARTLDLVILAAEWGSGRRQGWLSNLHLGARDVVKGGFAMLGKTFKGLTDELLAWQTQELLKREIGRDGHTVHVRPELVAEIAFNEIQVSARYVSGLALRFARVKRYRTDKSAAESDTYQTVLRMAGMSDERSGSSGGLAAGVLPSDRPTPLSRIDH